MSRNKNYQLQKPSNSIDFYATIWTICSKHYINLIIQSKISLSMYNFLMKFPYVNKQNVFYSLEQNLIMPSLFTPGPNHISWNHLKKILGNAKCSTNIVNIVNSCISLSYWPSHFKNLSFIIILRPNKSLYDTTKVFHPIILLNMLGKLIEKVISNRLQVYSITSNFIYSNQLGGIK